jgi:hypothetical protein
MTDRKWRIINETKKDKFYEKINKYEKEGYELIADSFTVSEASTHPTTYYCLMKNKKLVE